MQPCVPDVVRVGSNTASDAAPCVATCSNKHSASQGRKGVDCTHMTWAAQSASPPAYANMNQSHHDKQLMCYMHEPHQHETDIVLNLKWTDVMS